MNRYLQTLLLTLIILFSFVSKINAQVVINEFQLSPSSDQWIELFNKGAEQVDISGWIVDDKEGGSSKSFVIPTGSVLQPKKCISYESGNFDWNTASADEVRLIPPTLSIESYSYSSSPGNNVSIGRVTDGEGELVILTSQSRDSYNSGGGSCLAPTPSPTTEATAAPTASPTQTPAPTPTLTKTPTPFPTKAPTPKPVATSQIVNKTSSSPSANVLGLRNELSTSDPTSSLAGKKNFPFIAIIFVILGVSFVGFAGYLAYKKSKVDLPPQEM